MGTRKLTEVLNRAHAVVDDICRHSEGLDARTLLEAAMLTDDDFSEPETGEALIASLKNEGLL
jgi:hypothetical protein